MATDYAFVPPDHQRRVYRQILPGDLDHWAKVIDDARRAVMRPVEPRRKMLVGAHPPETDDNP